MTVKKKRVVTVQEQADDFQAFINKHFFFNL